MSRECQILRVFTRGELGGNHLGVVTDVAGLTTEGMQAIAADLGFSETVFCDVSGASVSTSTVSLAELPLTGLMARAIVLFAASILALGLVTLYVSREEEQ